MKKGAIYGIVAAFIIIAMLIFIPVIVNNSTPSAETASSASGADLTDPGTETTETTVTDSADTTETVSKESAIILFTSFNVFPGITLLKLLLFPFNLLLLTANL